MCNIAGGLVNITRNESARQRRQLNYNQRGHLTQLVYDMLGLPTTTWFAPSIKTQSRSTHDVQVMRKIQEQLERFPLFQIGGENIACISTGDISTQEITSDLLNALDRGRQMSIHSLISV